MHGIIRDRLEDLLATDPPSPRLHQPTASELRDGVTRHLSSCAECSSELESLKRQSAALRSLRAPDELEPSAGFYARVLQRIEDRAKDSLWSVFAYGPFGKRLAYVSLAVAALLGTYVVGVEARDGHLGGTNVVAQEQLDASCFGSPAQQRDAVLANFASSEGSLQ